MTTANPSPRRWSVPWRAAVSVWLVFHITAVVIAPLSVSPSSLLVRDTWQGYRSYLQGLYLNHGYHYFAPEPGESTLLAYTLEFADGRVEQGRIPRREISPRLLYHRHFMLTEFLGFPTPELQRTLYRSYARHLCRTHKAERVSLTRVTHFLPQMEMVREGVRLDDPASYSEEPLGTFECDDL